MLKHSVFRRAHESHRRAHVLFARPRPERMPGHRITSRPAIARRALRRGHPSPATHARRVPRLGDLLLAHGHVSPAALAAALLRQRTSGRRLGHELLRAGHVRRAHLDFALRLQRRLAIAALASSVAVASMTGGLAAAGGFAAALGVHAFVPPNAAMQIVHQENRLTIGPNDIARGYIDVPAASRVKVMTSSRAGFVLDFFPRNSIFKSVQVSGAHGRAEFGYDGGAVVARDSHGGPRLADLDYRFYLADGVAPGTYEWPLAMSVRPL